MVFASRVLSVILSMIYGFLAARRSGETLIYLLMFLVLPLAAVWFPTQIGAATGMIDPFTVVTRPSPLVMVLLLGWILLLMPLWLLFAVKALL